MLKFEINNDLNNIQASWHNMVHFFGSLLIALCAPLYASDGQSGMMVSLSGFIVSYGLWIAWEIGDGFKPWWYTFKNKYGGDWRDWLRKELLYSDKFSLQDVLVWNLSGSFCGSIIVFIILWE